MFRISRTLGLCALLALASSPLWGQVYTWKDAQGNRVYSDQPHPDAESVELEPVNTIEPPPPSVMRAQRESEASDAGQAQSQDIYQRLAITAPDNDQAIRANDGNVTLTVAVEPALGRNHLLRAEIDGEASSSAVPGSGQNVVKLTLGNIDRGTHSVSAVVVNAQGDTVQRSSPIKLHVQRTSLNQPARGGANQAPQAPAAPRAPNVPAP
ncbi:MAG TPA: DUF4124 domain-containing protein [Pseudomonas xinjiangensis]|uniref:DUF4124 domain-containing protein n=2 Tax=root TaxID=1 RepID=A0A7V1BP49_9GAMM|nr:DUF4124 domain-containing protein [Halopseudomonas xinjiangensis]HEC48382.1 DUF4124 domain-containing protein [Halopseudomonas xinjiangensis]